MHCLSAAHFESNEIKPVQFGKDNCYDRPHFSAVVRVSGLFTLLKRPNF